jgi:large subunit ribosomal protein L30
MRRTLKALGLRRHQHEIVVRDTPSLRGMVYKVRHLVEVTPVGEDQ